jgi:hypothetical protein
MKSTLPYFRPVPAIPANTPVTSEAYASALRRTIDQLQRAADAAGITVPPKYDFSFSAQRPLVKFANGSLEPLAVQLGEVKAISEILFAARINAVDGIQRVRVSEDDMAGSQADYVDAHSVTNELAVLTPYVITFRCFTPELSHVLTGFASSSNAFIIKSIMVQPAGAVAAVDSSVQAMNARAMALDSMFFQPPPAVAPQPVATKGVSQAALKEQLLRVVVEVELVKLLPKS